MIGDPQEPPDAHDDDASEEGAKAAAYDDLVAVFSGLLDTLVGHDWHEDENYARTPHRVAQMYIDELCAGLYTRPPAVAAFTAGDVNEMCVLGPVSIRSLCAHHLLPVTGQAWVGLVPDEVVLGLSKYGRLLAWAFARPTLQESATVDAAKRIHALLRPKGLGLVVRASHGCMSCRGVKEPGAVFTTSYLTGCMEEASARAEFLTLVGLNQ